MDEIVEQVVRVVGPRRGFGMILDAEQRQRAMAEAFVRVIVQIEVGDFDIARRERVGINGKAVILGGDFDFLGAQILYRVVRAVVAEFQLEGFPPSARPKS